MIGRLYTVVFENVAVAAAQDLFEIQPADDRPIVIVGLDLDNVGGTSDAGDAQEELLRCSIIRGHTSSGSGGTAPTPRPRDANDAAAGFTAEVNNTTPASGGTTHSWKPFGWNVRIPLEKWFPEEAMVRASQADTTIVVRLHTAPADSLSASGTLYVAEL